MSSGARPMRVLVCDDDPGVRMVVTEMVEERAGQVIAETDHSIDAIDLIERFEPDVVVVDLGLAHGSGHDIIDFVGGLRDPPLVVVFTAFDGAGLGAGSSRVQVVIKPDFDLLGRRLDAAYEESHQDRRKPMRDAPRPGGHDPPGVDDVDDFYRTLADAHPEDTLMSVSLEGLDSAAVIDAARRTIRAQDRLITRGRLLMILLISGEAAAPTAVCDRLTHVVPDIAARASGRPCGTDPIETFTAVVAGAADEP